MIKAWHEPAWDEYLKWHGLDHGRWDKVNDLLKDVERHPFTGIGKPEPLKGNLRGYWSRRIDAENRLVYAIKANGVVEIRTDACWGRAPARFPPRPPGRRARNESAPCGHYCKGHYRFGP
jgi:toxin YoeB